MDDAFLEGLPKVELHLHIEGTLEPELMFALAHRNQVKIPFKTVEEVRKAYRFSSLQDFLDIYYQSMNVLKKEQDFYDLTWAYLNRVAKQNVVHAEIFFDPQAHTSRGVKFETALNGITRALEDGQKKLGISSKLVMCFLRHLSEEDALKTLDEAMPYKDKIFAVGLDSSEMGHPPSKFKRVFAKAKEKGFRIVAHAGEEGPPEYVWEALDQINVSRINHGNRSLEDQKLVSRLVKDQIPLTICPLSNVKLRVVNDIKKHPLKKMLDLGLKATISSDDPAYFGGYMNENFKAVAGALDLSRQDFETISRNSIDASFLSRGEKTRLRRKLDEYLKAAQTVESSHPGAHAA
jgi:adenosine deaminase